MFAPVAFVENPAGMAEILYSPRGPAAEYLTYLARLTQDGAKSMVGVKTGNLRDHIDVRFGIDAGLGPVVQVGSDWADPGTGFVYAEVHHEGRPEIFSDTLMTFQVSLGEWRSTYHVAAAKANPFLRVPMERAVEGGTAGGEALHIFADLFRV